MSDGDTGKNVKRGRKAKVEHCLKSKGEKRGQEQQEQNQDRKSKLPKGKKVTKKLSTKKSQNNKNKPNPKAADFNWRQQGKENKMARKKHHK